jgi:hypothetical protein
MTAACILGKDDVAVAGALLLISGPGSSSWYTRSYESACDGELSMTDTCRIHKSGFEARDLRPAGETDGPLYAPGLEREGGARN